MKYLFIVFLMAIAYLSQASTLESHLFPSPKEIQYQVAVFARHTGHIKNQTSQSNLNFAIKEKLSKIGVQLNLDVVDTNSVLPLVKINIDSTELSPQQYQLNISTNNITIIGGDDAGVYYAYKTLCQIIDYTIENQQTLSCLQIKDWPDFERRGYMLDISRDKVPTMETLYHIIDLLDRYKINEFQLYTEHTFAYKNHKEVWKDASPITPDEIHQLDRYCKNKHIDLVPNQNSFGHMERWLKHDTYLPLAEAPNPVKTIWGTRSKHSLNPLDTASLYLMEELYAELSPNFSSKYLNIGCDETIELGYGKSKTECERIGKGNVYLNYLKQLNEAANKNGKLAQFWGDIILNHPELISEIPTNMTAVVWGYDGDFAFDEKLPKFKDAGLDYYVCPGTSTWRSLIGRNKNAFDNLKNAAINGYQNNAKGYLNTNWGDYGHWQPLSVCYPAMLYGASMAWNTQSKPESQLENVMNRDIFKDSTGMVSQTLLKLGNAYLNNNIPNGNANAYHMFLRRHMWTIKGHYQLKHATIDGLKKSADCIQEALDQLKDASPQCENSDILIAEINQAAQLALHGCKNGIARLKAKDNEVENIVQTTKDELISDLTPLIKNHRKLWIIRNRKGGLSDSEDKLKSLLEAYK
ncbi:family 20 glycosylhydrolase [bacterium]|nr:family 20 glycosylhydrolase [bacterium]